MTFVNSSSTGTQAPVFDYTSRDYTSIITDLMNRIPVYLPEWTSQSPSDFGIVLLQMYAYVGDILGYYLDRLAGEAFIQTATQPSSIINLAAMLGYTPTLSMGSSATLQITIGSSVVSPVTVPFGAQFATQASPISPPIIFQTTEELVITPPQTTGQVNVVQGQTFTSLPKMFGVIDVWAEFNVPSSAIVVPDVAVSNGSTNQTYPFLYDPVSANSFSVFVDLGVGPEEWTYVPSLVSSGPNDHNYTNFVDANGIFYVIFGDGVNGLVPPLGSPIYALYQTNVGDLGNVGPGTITTSVTGIIGVTSINNSTGATGGADAESIASIQQNAPAALRTLNRAVTVSDIQDLAVQVAGVQWASAVEQTYQLVNLYIAPSGGGVPNPTIQNAVLNFVDPLTMPNTTITVFPPTYVPINMTIDLVVDAIYGNNTTQMLVQNALAELLSLPNVGFGFRVALGLVYQTILSQLGVNYAIVTSMYRGFDATLTAPLVNGNTYTGLSVSPLPQPVYGGDLIIITNPLTVTLGSPLLQGSGYTSLNVSTLTQDFVSHDSLILTAPNGATQTVTVASTASAGSNTISVSSFTASALFPSGSTVFDATASPNTQQDIVVSGSSGSVVANPGAVSIPTVSFTAGADFPIGTYVADVSGASDCVLLENEIPVLGQIIFSPPVSGGLIGS